MAGWWQQDCPARGAGLTHAHWNRCDPGEVHPPDGTKMAGRTHDWNMCCHCEQVSASEKSPEADIAIPEPSDIPRGGPLADHEYRWTIAGRCARCQRTSLDHPVFKRGVESGECSVDHNSIASKLLINDGGLERTTCPICNMQVEPKLATGQPTGVTWGPGRGSLTQRHMDKLINLVKREQFLAYLAERNGGHYAG